MIVSRVKRVTISRVQLSNYVKLRRYMHLVRSVFKAAAPVLSYRYVRIRNPPGSLAEHHADKKYQRTTESWRS